MIGNALRSVALIVLVALALSACGLSGNTPLTLSEQDAGKTVQIRSGDTLAVTLEGNPTTGYGWEMAPSERSILQQVGDPEFQADSKALGAGGLITLRFKAMTSGQMRLQLLYHRSWEKGVEPLKTYEVQVVVK